jgi:Intracellular proteinase inhibitor
VWYSLLLSAAILSDSMTLELSAPHEARAGEPIPFTIRLGNTGSAPLTLYLRGRPVAFDVIVTDARGRVVWRRLQDAAVSMALQVRELKSGETLTFEERWSQHTNAGAQAQPGEYRVKGEILTDTDTPLETPIHSFRITP